MQGRKKYEEKLFTSFQLSNHVPENNFYRRLKGELDLHYRTNFTKTVGKTGQLLKVLINAFENLKRLFVSPSKKQLFYPV